MNVLVLEDDPSAISVIGYLNDRGCKVWHAQNLLDVAYYLEKVPGLDTFDKLMFDVAVPLNTFPFMGNEPFEYGEKYGFSGFEFVAKNYNLLNLKNIALITAYKTTLYENVYDEEEDLMVLEKLTVLDKASDDFLMQLMNFLNE